jgi:hypothetical protein
MSGRRSILFQLEGVAEPANRRYRQACRQSIGIRDSEGPL